MRMCFPRFQRTISPPRRFVRRLVVSSLVFFLMLAAINPVWARKAPPIGSHIPPGDRPSGIPLAVWQTLFAGTTPSGKRLSASELGSLVVSAKWPPVFWTRVGWHLKIGVFLLSVRNDGTVSNVEILHSTGQRFLDRDVVRAFAKWRFRPNSVKEVRIPAYYTEI